MKAWVDGTVVDAREAVVPVLDHGLLYGDGVFEGIRISRRRIFRLDDHLRRFETSARAIGITLAANTAAPHVTNVTRDRSETNSHLVDIVVETSRAFGGDEGYVRLIATRGEGPLGVDPTTCPKPRLLCLVGEAVQLYGGPAGRGSGISLITSSYRKPALDAIDPRVKSLNYLNSVLVKGEARRLGADDGLVLNAQGRVVEVSVANVFAVIDGKIFTPPPNDGALAGITRRTVLESAAAARVPAAESSLSRIDLIGADEVFLTGSGAGIVPVASLDGLAVGKPGGARPVTAQVHDLMEIARARLGTPF